mmetsp:Transcript_20284/g.30509  ORF Transcript_20284/g.30509 Transcript_20284/m.30509 type:complete len:85 (-) Transcript_20284:616-870(-)
MSSHKPVQSRTSALKREKYESNKIYARLLNREQGYLCRRSLVNPAHSAKLLLRNSVPRHDNGKKTVLAYFYPWALEDNIGLEVV